MIPVRVSAMTRPPEVGPPKFVPAGHTLARLMCPVCDERLLGTTVTLVVVGSQPACRRSEGWVQAAAVAIHTHCSFGFSQ